MRRAALLLVALALAGCETTAEESARLERAANRAGGDTGRDQKGLHLTRAGKDVRVLSATLLSSSEGDAVVVRLANRTATALHEVPLSIAVRDPHGATVYANDVPGLARSLVSVPVLPPHGQLTWVDDQVSAAAATDTVAAIAGEAPRASGPIPRVVVSGVHLSSEGGEGTHAEGTVSNRSRVAQRELVVYATAERAGRAVAAGRAVLPELGPGASAGFQIFLIGNATGAQLKLSAPATTLG